MTANLESVPWFAFELATLDPLIDQGVRNSVDARGEFRAKRAIS
jgi:hypothetical protein